MGGEHRFRDNAYFVFAFQWSGHRGLTAAKAAAAKAVTTTAAVDKCDAVKLSSLFTRERKTFIIFIIFIETHSLPYCVTKSHGAQRHIEIYLYRRERRGTILNKRLLAKKKEYKDTTTTTPPPAVSRVKHTQTK